MITHRLLAALGTSACVTAAVLAAVTAALRSFDRALADYSVEVRDVPVNWIAEFDAWEAGK